jgi:DNA-binding MarR family transcriptional regulator
MPRPSQLNPMEIADRLHSAAIHLLRTAAKTDVLSGQGPARLSALSVLVFRGPKTLGELAASERVKPPTMTRIVRGLHRSGLASLQKDAKDARKVRISVTAKGRHVLEEARRRRIRALTDVLTPLNSAELDTLNRAAHIVETALRGRLAG